MEILPTSFKKILKEGRFPSPLILEGPQSEEAAVEVVRFALCDNFSNCGECGGCKKVAKDFHPDWVRLPSDFKLDDIREALMKLRQMPFEAKFRAILIPGLNIQRVQIQNALLKTLEEPSSKWMIILSVESRWSLLETIRSRCLILRLSTSDELSLDDDERSLFQAIESADELQIQSRMDVFMKDRSTARSVFQRLLAEASYKKFPGAWRALAPHLEDGLWDLNRNLHQKVIWDRAWSRSMMSS